MRAVRCCYRHAFIACINTQRSFRRSVWATHKQSDVRSCEGFQMPAVRGVVMFSGGRRRKTSNGGNRGGEDGSGVTCAMGI